MNDLILHPMGECDTAALVPVAGPVAVDTFGGRIHVEWDSQAAVTLLGQLPFFTEFLQVSGMSAVVSEDSVRRNFGKLDETAGVQWLQDHLGYCVAPVPVHRSETACVGQQLLFLG